MKHLITLLITLFTASAFAEEGWQTIFNGKDLDGWDGRQRFWRVQDGHIRGMTTKDVRAPGNTFLIWKGGKTKNFELKVSYRILTGNNSGVQYRSKITGDWVVGGYQAEVENRLGKTGFLYHERGRGWLVDVGDFMEIGPDGKKQVVGVCADQQAIIKAPYHTNNDWNHYHFICRGNHVIHTLNGYQTVELIDRHADPNDPDSNKHRRLDGVLALQIHGGGAMTVDFKDIAIKQLGENYGEAKRLFNGTDINGWSGNAAGWSAVALSDGWKSGRKTKVEGELKVMKCDGTGTGSIYPDVATGANYDVRFQVRKANSKKSSGAGSPHKRVLGWDSYEFKIRDKKTVGLTINGAKAPIGKDVKGGVMLPSNVAAEYRNLVLIPIE